MKPVRTIAILGTLPVKTTDLASVEMVGRFWNTIYLRWRLPMGRRISALVPFDQELFDRMSNAVLNGDSFELSYKTEGSVVYQKRIVNAQ